MALFVGVDFLQLLFFFFAMDKANKNKNKNAHWTNGVCKKEEIYFVQTAEYPV